MRYVRTMAHRADDRGVPTRFSSNTAFGDYSYLIQTEAGSVLYLTSSVFQLLHPRLV